MLQRAAIAIIAVALSACSRPNADEVSIGVSQCWPVMRDKTIVRGEAAVYLNGIIVALYNPGCEHDVLTIVGSREKISPEYKIFRAAENRSDRVIWATFAATVEGVVEYDSGKLGLRITRITRKAPVRLRVDQGSR